MNRTAKVVRLQDQGPRKEWRLARLPDDYISDAKRIMQRFNLLSKNDVLKRREDDVMDWKKASPRWFLLAIIAAGLVYLGFLMANIESGRAREQQRLEAAILDAPTKYQARLSERVAVVEAQTQQLSKSVDDLTVAVRAQNQASIDVTYQLKLLTAEMKVRR